MDAPQIGKLPRASGDRPLLVKLPEVRLPRVSGESPDAKSLLAQSIAGQQRHPVTP